MTQPGVNPRSPASDEVITIEAVWPDDTGANAEAANQFVFAWDQEVEDALYIYFGHLAPPPWLTPEIAKNRLNELHHKLPITPKGSFIVSRTKAEELWTMLGRHIGKLPPK